MHKHLLSAIKFIILFSLLGGAIERARAQQPVIASHPRIFVNGATKAVMAAKVSQNDPDWLALKAQADNYATGTVIPWNETSASDAQYYGTNDVFYDYCGSNWEEAAMTLGLAHQLTKTSNAGANPTKYSDKMLEFADVITQAYQTYPPGDGALNIFQYNTSYATRHVGKTIAVIYDMCYDELGATRKAALLTVMKDWFNYMSGAPYRVFQEQDQPTGNYFMGHVICAGYMGLAIGSDDPLSQKMIDFARQRLTGQPGTLNRNTTSSGESANNYFTQSIKGGLPTDASESYLGPKKYVGNPQVDGLQNQGWAYGGETIEYMVDYLTAVKTATGEDMLQTEPDLKTFFAKSSISFVHAFTPNRFQIDNGNDNGGFIGNVANYGLALRLSAILEGTAEGANMEYFRTKLLQPITLTEYNVGTQITNWEAVYYKKTRVATPFSYKPYYPIPTTNTYSGSGAINAGMHKFIMRSDWGASATWASVFMGAGVYDSHKHNNTGHFQIVRGDSHDGDDELLIGANEVAKAGGNGIDGPTNYSFASSFSNTLYFNDFNDYDIPYQDYPDMTGGQTDNGYDAPTHEEQNDDFSYFRADITSPYYISYYQPPISQRTLLYYYRSFLYLRDADIFVVYDKFSAKHSTNPMGQYLKHLRWHFLTPPTINGSNITEVMDNSKLFIHTVIPATVNVAVVNENTNPDNTFGSSYDYAFNTNTWRAEVSVPGNPLTQDIVTVLQPGSNASLTEMTTAAIATTQNNMQGTMVTANGKTEVILFNTATGQYPAPVTTVSYSFSGPVTAYHLLCGADPGKAYAVSYSGGVVTATESASGNVTASPSGVLRFTIQSLSLNNNALLSSLVTNAGALTPVFNANTSDYTIKVNNTVSSITVTPKAANAGATITINGVAVASRSASAPIALSVGKNTITIVVTAQNGLNTSTYTLSVYKGNTNDVLSFLRLNTGTLSPAFNYQTNAYTAIVGSGVTSIKVAPTLYDVNATVTVNGVAVASAALSQPIALAIGQNTINVVVTAQNGLAANTYTIVVTRLSNVATLSALKISSGSLSPAFASATNMYSAPVAGTVTSITVTPTLTDSNASLQVNGTVVASGAPSGAIPLNVGLNTITVLVTAQDGTTTHTYTLKVYQGASNDVLSFLRLSSGTLSPAFNYQTNLYTASVANNVSTIKVTPTLYDTNATVTVNGVAVVSATPSQAIALAVGQNIISVVVTAQNGFNTNTYNIGVTRAAGGADAFDNTISVSDAKESPVTDEDLPAVHSSLSPNGDGVNDYLIIDGIQGFPDNHLTIMNRNGEMIFDVKGYDNQNHVFDGHSGKTRKMELPGTYFYQLDYTVKGLVKHKTGYLVLKY